MDIVKGATDQTTYVMLVDSASGQPETGLTVTGIDATYVRDRAAAVKNDITEALAAADSAHADNKALEVDGTNAPGLYRIDWPDAPFATGVDRVQLIVTCAGCAPAVQEVQLKDAAAGALTAAERISIADALYVRDVDNVEASAGYHTLCGAVLRLVSKNAPVGTDLVTYRTNGSTAFGKQALTVDADLDPIESIGIMVAP